MLYIKRHKFTRAYLLAVLFLLFIVNTARAAENGRTTFKVGSKPVERVVQTNVPDDHAIFIRVYIDGKQADEGMRQGCSIYFHRAWVTVRVTSCESWDYVKIRATNTGKTKRVTFVWEDFGAIEG